MKSSPTVRSQLLLIDTCVVIEAHRLHVWESLLSQCHIVVPETVVGEAILVARGFDDISLRLEQQIKEGLIQSPSLNASALAIVSQRCPHFPGKMDPGEQECLAFLLRDASDITLICSSDAVVFRFLGWLQKADRGLSLEEVLRTVGLGRPVSRKLSKKFREYWTQKGFQEALQRGFINPSNPSAPPLERDPPAR